MGYYADYYRADVIEVMRLTPTMVRIRFGGEDLRRFASTEVGDERLCVVFPSDGSRTAPEPTRMPDGTLDYPDGEPELRSYTVRAWDAAAGVMTIDFVAHEGGVAAQWALQAEPGDTVYLTPASGWYAPPADADWLLLVADLTALPALGRIVEALPSGRRVHCVVEVADAADRQQIDTVADVTWDWRVGGNGHGPSGLLDAVRGWSRPGGRGYVWFAGEAAESRAVRKFVRRELGFGVDQFTILGYWRADKEAWMRRYATMETELEQVYERALAEGQTENDALEIYDAALEKAGL